MDTMSSDATMLLERLWNTEKRRVHDDMPLASVQDDNTATITTLNSQLNACLLASAVCIARMQPTINAVATDLQHATPPALHTYHLALQQLQHAVEQYYSNHLHSTAAKHMMDGGVSSDDGHENPPNTQYPIQGLTPAQYHAVQREVQRLRHATALTHQQHIAAQALLAHKRAAHQYVQHALQQARDGSLSHTGQAVGDTGRNAGVGEQDGMQHRIQGLRGMEAQHMQRVTQQCCEAADHQAYRLLSTDYHLKALRLQYALQCKQTVVDTLVHMVSQLLLLHAVHVGTQQAAHTVQSIASVAQQLAADLHGGATTRITATPQLHTRATTTATGKEDDGGTMMRDDIGSEREEEEEDNVQWDGVMLQEALSSMLTAGSLVEDQYSQQLTDQYHALLALLDITTNGGGDGGGGDGGGGDGGDGEGVQGLTAHPIRIPTPLHDAYTTLQTHHHALSDAVDMVLATLTAHQQQVMTTPAVGLQRKVLKHFFTNPRKLASLAKAAAAAGSGGGGGGWK